MAFGVAWVLVALIARVAVSGTGARDRGAEALVAGDELGATVAYREAVAWYLPGAWWRSEGFHALWALHARQREEGRLADAARTLQSLRSGLFAARSVIHPDPEWLGAVDGALPGLMAAWEAEAAMAEGREAPGERSEREGWFAAGLAKDERPARGWSLLAVSGFALWVGAGLWATRAQGRSRVWAVSCAVAGFAALMAGVAWA